MTIKLGFIGAGFIAQVAHLPAFSKSDHFSSVAIADPRTDVRDAVATHFGIGAQFDSHVDLLRSGVVDAVVVTLPRRLTARVVEDCLAYETWVFAEKPLLLNRVSAANILSKVGSRGVCVGLMKRCDPGVQYAKAVIERNLDRLGHLESVGAECHAGDSYVGIGGDIKSEQGRVLVSVEEKIPNAIQPDLHYRYEQFLNVYSHTLNLAEFLTGLPVTLTTGVHAPSGAGHFIGFLGSLPFALTVSRGKSHPWTESVALRFENAIITVRMPAAFDRSGSAELDICAIPDLSLRSVNASVRSWAFEAQPERFRALISGQLSPIEDILSAWRYAEDCERLFSKL
jgi:predicted dehydrogenase